MRALILIAVTALGLAACRNNDQADNTMNFDENLAAENIVSNDVTAIDAVTGEAANMAADVNYIDIPETNSGGEAPPTRSGTAKPAKSPPTTKPSATTQNTAAPATPPATGNTATE
jgi:hypothetical protein